MLILASCEVAYTQEVCMCIYPCNAKIMMPSIMEPHQVRHFFNWTQTHCHHVNGSQMKSNEYNHVRFTVDTIPEVISASRLYVPTYINVYSKTCRWLPPSQVNAWHYQMSTGWSDNVTYLNPPASVPYYPKNSPIGCSEAPMSFYAIHGTTLCWCSICGEAAHSMPPTGLSASTNWSAVVMKPGCSLMHNQYVGWLRCQLGWCPQKRCWIACVSLILWLRCNGHWEIVGKMAWLPKGTKSACFNEVKIVVGYHG